MIGKFENFCKLNLVYRIPSIIKQKLLKIRMNIDEDEDELDFKSRNFKVEKAKQIFW
jgi:hypothetical protein